MRDFNGQQFENPDNRDFFTVIRELYTNEGKIDLENFKDKYSDMNIYWETLAAIGVVSGDMRLLEYAQNNHIGGRVNMCTALENLRNEGRQEGRQEAICKMVEILIQLGIEDDVILQKMQDKFDLTFEEAQGYLR